MCVRPLLALSCCLAFAWVCFGGENLLLNPAFEDVAAADGGVPIWKTSGGQFSLAAGEGRNGTKAMKWDAAADPKKRRSVLSQRVRVKPGRHYRFEVWIRTEGLACGEHGATAWVDWCDEKGKYLGETYLFGVRSKDSEWRKVEGVTSRLPSNAAFAVFMAGVDSGTAGVACFDDCRLCEVVDTPIPLLVSDCYRDVAWNGRVTFSAALDLKAAGLEAGKARGEFSYLAADGSKKRVPAETLSADRATISLPVEGLATGRHDVAFRLYGSGGREAGTASVAFTRLSSSPGWRVTIDRHRRVVVDGKLFFPLGLYNGGLSKGQVEKFWKGSPFNCIMPYSMPAPDEIDFAYANGLMAMVSLKDAFAGSPHCPKEIASESDEERFVADAVAKFKDKPGLLAWYVNDEADIGKATRLSARRNLLERLDPDHPTWGVIYQIEDARGYVRTADVHGSDPYPIPGDIGKCLSDSIAMNVGSMGTRAVWQVPQIFDWCMYHKPPRPDERAPTEDEMRNMSWQSIAGGANGLVYYSYHCLWAMRAKDPFEKRWAECCKVADEIRRLFPILLSDPATLRFSRGVPEKLGWRAWSYEGDAYVLFVNASRERIAAALSPEIAVEGTAQVFGNGAVTASCGALAVDLPPLGVGIVKMKWRAGNVDKR